MLISFGLVINDFKLWPCTNIQPINTRNVGHYLISSVRFLTLHMHFILLQKIYHFLLLGSLPKTKSGSMSNKVNYSHTCLASSFLLLVSSFKASFLFCISSSIIINYTNRWNIYVQFYYIQCTYILNIKIYGNICPINYRN